MSALDNLRKSAKRWLHAVRAGDAAALARLRQAYPQAQEEVTLRDVQHALARERGYESWLALTRAPAADTAADSPLTSLLAAASQGDATAAASLLDRHPELINQRGALAGHTGLRTALHFGIRHEAVVRLLLERGADPNIRDEGDNAFPIHFAAERGDLAVVQLLLEHGADPVGAGTTHELDVLGWAVCFDYATHLEIARCLLAHGARTTLFSAVALGETAAIRELVAAGADLNQRMDRTNRRRAALHLAVIKKQPAALTTLIELGASLNLEDAVGLTTLDQAALDGETAMARQLLDAGAALTLPAAIVLDHPGQVEKLLRDDPNALTATDNRRWARLLTAASARASAPVLEALLRTAQHHRAGLTIVNLADDEETAVDGTSGYTPLHAAAFRGNDAAVAVLLRHGANPRARDGKYCGTPAGWAAYAGHAVTANRILESDIDIFDAVDFDRADRVAAILDRDPEALDRPFSAYAECAARNPHATPLEWAVAQNKPNAARVLAERGATQRGADDQDHARRVHDFLHAACWDGRIHGKRDHRMHDSAAQRLLAHDPSIARDSLYTAVVCGDLAEVARIVAERPEAARTPGGARGWTPLLYLAYTRFTHPATLENALPIARLLLDHGANANDFYMAGDSPYTALVGVAGEGEQDAPRQPWGAAVFDLLLERGAEPFDLQVLYNTHFSGDILWWLKLVYRRTAESRADAWADPEWRVFDMGNYGSGARFMLETAVRTRRMDLAAWLLAHGANPNAAPARDPRFPKFSLRELALREDLPAFAELFARHGAAPPADADEPLQRFTVAALHLEREEARRLLAAHPEIQRSPQPMFAAAKRDRPDALALLLELGFPLEAQDAAGKRALHEAAATNSLRAVQFLIERGAEVDPRDATYHGTPLGWAAHADRTEMVRLLSRYSHDLWALGYNGFPERVREVLAEDPSLARAVAGDGTTPLWWLPDDETQAIEIAGMLMAAGANPAARNRQGSTAADQARRRGMFQLAVRLEDGTSPRQPDL